MVEGYSRNVMVKYVCFNDVIGDVATNEFQISIDRCGALQSPVAAACGIMWKNRIGVLKCGYCYCDPVNFRA